jgi:hypothetical protein
VFVIRIMMNPARLNTLHLVTLPLDSLTLLDQLIPLPILINALISSNSSSTVRS